MKISESQIGQPVEVAFWYRYGRDGKDYAAVQGIITRIMECYNRIQIDVKKVFADAIPIHTHGLIVIKQILKF